jgi:hypothetical protein
VSVDGRVGIYRMTGPGLGGLEFLACGNVVGFPLQNGSTYYFQVSGTWTRAPNMSFLLEPGAQSVRPTGISPEGRRADLDDG